MSFSPLSLFPFSLLIFFFFFFSSVIDGCRNGSTRGGKKYVFISCVRCQRNRNLHVKVTILQHIPRFPCDGTRDFPTCAAAHFPTSALISAALMISGGGGLLGYTTPEPEPWSTQRFNEEKGRACNIR